MLGATTIDTAPPDLRSRKRAAAIRHIQRIAAELFDEHGYAHVSVAQIAAAAKVGERTVYRYFGTKARILLHDEADPASLASFQTRLRTQPLLEAARGALGDVTDLLGVGPTDDARRRLRHVDDHSELQAALASYVHLLGVEFGEVIADVRGVEPDDLAAQIHGRCLVTALSTAVDRWRHGTAMDLTAELDAALEVLAAGFGP